MALPDPASHLQFLTGLLERVDTSKSPEAHVLLLATLAHAKLLFGDHEGTKNDIDAAWKVLDELSGVDPSVNAAYYEVAADYYKVRGEAPHATYRVMSESPDHGRCRRRRNMRPTTRIRCCILRVSTLQRT